MFDRSHASLCVSLMVLLSVIALGAPLMRAPADNETPVAATEIASIPEAAPRDTIAAPEELAAPEPLPIAIPPLPVIARRMQTGIASWYGEHWQGRKTASGVPFDTAKLTAAHRSLPLNTVVRVTNLLNGRSVEVTVNDRGPYVGRRVIDLSEAAAHRIGMIKKGLVPVRIEMVPPPQMVAAS